VWEFTLGAEKGKIEALVITAVVGDIPVSTGTDYVDFWFLSRASWLIQFTELTRENLPGDCERSEGVRMHGMIIGRK
jgi:hypothetical protein